MPMINGYRYHYLKDICSVQMTHDRLTKEYFYPLFFDLLFFAGFFFSAAGFFVGFALALLGA